MTLTEFELDTIKTYFRRCCGRCADNFRYVITHNDGRFKLGVGTVWGWYDTVYVDKREDLRRGQPLKDVSMKIIVAMIGDED